MRWSIWCTIDVSFQYGSCTRYHPSIVILHMTGITHIFKKRKRRKPLKKPRKKKKKTRKNITITPPPAFHNTTLFFPTDHPTETLGKWCWSLTSALGAGIPEQNIFFCKTCFSCWKKCCFCCFFFLQNVFFFSLLNKNMVLYLLMYCFLLKKHMFCIWSCFVVIFLKRCTNTLVVLFSRIWQITGLLILMSSFDMVCFFILRSMTKNKPTDLHSCLKRIDYGTSIPLAGSLLHQQW